MENLIRWLDPSYYIAVWIALLHILNSIENSPSEKYLDVMVGDQPPENRESGYGKLNNKSKWKILNWSFLDN